MVLNSKATDKLWASYFGLVNVTRSSSLRWETELKSIQNDIDRLIELQRADDCKLEPMTVEEVSDMIALFFGERKT